MQRLILAFSLALLLGACGSIGVGGDRVALREPVVSDEMDCMADCLQDTSETCESCADNCLQRPASPSVASAP
jgi:hypothetical protein